MDLMVTARAVDVPIVGCDMPRALSDRIAGVRTDLVDHLRELHCALALAREQRAGSSNRVALLWGRDHLRSEGFRRFLPDQAMAIPIFLIGERPGELTPEARLGPSLVVNQPFLVSLDESATYALVLGGSYLGGRVEQSRLTVSPPELGLAAGERELVVTADRPGTLFLGARVVPLREEPVTVSLPDEALTYYFRAERVSVVGILPSWGPGRVELTLDVGTRETRVAYFVTRALQDPRLTSAPVVVSEVGTGSEPRPIR